MSREESAKAVLREEVALRPGVAAVEIGLRGSRRQAIDRDIELLWLVEGEVNRVAEDVFAIPERREIAAVEAEEHAGAGRDHVAVASPDRAVDGFERAVVIPVGVEERAARQQRAVGGNERGDVRMGAIPPEIVVVVAELEFAGEARCPGVHPVAGDACRVLVERGDEVRIGLPDEVGLFEPRDVQPRHDVVAPAIQWVVAAFECDQAIDDDGLGYGVGRNNRRRLAKRFGPGYFVSKLVSEPGRGRFSAGMKLVVGSSYVAGASRCGC